MDADHVPSSITIGSAVVDILEDDASGGNKMPGTVTAPEALVSAPEKEPTVVEQESIVNIPSKSLSKFFNLPFFFFSYSVQIYQGRPPNIHHLVLFFPFLTFCH